MAEERTSGLKESLQAGASMAHAVKGAVKAVGALMVLWQAHCGKGENRSARL